MVIVERGEREEGRGKGRWQVGNWLSSLLDSFFSWNSELFFPLTCLFFPSESEHHSASGCNLVIAQRTAGTRGLKVNNLIEDKHPKFIANHFHVIENIFFLFSFCRNCLKPPWLGPPT